MVCMMLRGRKTGGPFPDSKYGPVKETFSNPKLGVGNARTRMFPRTSTSLDGGNSGARLR